MRSTRRFRAPDAGRLRVQPDTDAAGSEKERTLAASVPVKRLGEAADVARAVTFFTSPDAGFVTGQVLYVCGGTSVGSLTLRLRRAGRVLHSRTRENRRTASTARARSG